MLRLTGKTVVRYLILVSFVLATLLVAGCGGGGGGGESAASMAEGRSDHTATLLKDGRLLVVGGKIKGTHELEVIGGQERGYTALATAEVYNPSTGAWSSVGSMAQARAGHTATLLGDGKVLVVGATNAVEVYDPSTGVWSPTGSMAVARVLHTATLLRDGRVLVAAGVDPSRAVTQELSSAEVYDPSTGEWSSTGRLGRAASNQASALLPDGRVLVVGRYQAEVYDPSTGTWALAGKLARERLRGFPATVLPDGRVLIAGGEVFQWGTPTVFYPVKNADIYDPATGTWLAATPMQEGHKLQPAVLLKDGRVLVIGGTVVGNRMEVYDPATDSWSPAGKLRESRVTGHTATLLENGKVLIVGGNEVTKTEFFGLKTAETLDSATIGR